MATCRTYKRSKSQFDSVDSPVLGDVLDGQFILNLPVSQASDEDLRASTNRKEIAKAAKLLRAIGDQLDREYKIQRKSSADEDRGSTVENAVRCMGTLVNAIDTVLTWLEQTAHDESLDIRKQEGILRGLTEIIDLGNQIGVMTVIQMAATYLDIPYKQFEVEKEYIQKCLKNIESHEAKIVEKVTSVGDILRKLIQQTLFNEELAKLFDNTAREAWLEIEECQLALDGANDATEKLLWKVTIIKWASRGIWMTGTAMMSWYMYQMYQSGDVRPTTAVATSLAVGLAWMTVVPRKAFHLYEAIRKLQYEHKDLEDKLHNLKKKLESHEDAKNNGFSSYK